MTLLTFFECCYFVVSGRKIKTTGLNIVVAEGRHFNFKGEVLTLMQRIIKTY